MAGSQTRNNIQLPFMSPVDGACVADRAASMDEWKREQSQSVSHEKWATADTVAAKPVTLRLVTYNTTTVIDMTQRLVIERMCEVNGVSVIGLQETRGREQEVRDGSYFRMFASAGINGQLGCNIWLRKSSFWDLDSCAIGVSEPRLLCVFAKVESCQFALIAAHALHSDHPDDVIDQWWMRFRALLNSLQTSTCSIVFIDANARFSLDAHGNRAPANRNAKRMLHCEEEHCLVSTQHVDDAGNPVVTWVSPRHTETVLDYIMMPSSVGVTMRTKGQPHEVCSLTSGWDHRPLLAEVDVELRSSTPCKNQDRLDRRALTDPKNQGKLEAILGRVPSCPWNVEVNRHVEVVHDCLRRDLILACPLKKMAPNKDFISEETWSLIRAKREHRRILHYMRRAMRKEVLACCFCAWKSGEARPGRVGKSCRRHLNAARVARTARSLARDLRSCVERDKAEHVKKAFAEARDQGAAPMATLIRGILRTGKRFRSPKLSPCLTVEDGTFEADPDKTLHILGAHFATNEQGVLRRQSKVEHEVQPVPPLDAQQVQELQTLPSFVEVAEAFRSMKTGKAPGLAGIPSEVFSQMALQSAQIFYPIMLKMALGGVAPKAWRKVWCVPYPKPAKPIGSLSAWRSMALMEPSTKGIARALRQKLLKCWAPRFRSVQGGSQKGTTLEYPVALAEAHARKLAQSKRTDPVLGRHSRLLRYSA